MERRPAPAPWLNPLFAWPLAVGTWLVATGCFISYLSFGDRYLSRSCSESVAAGVASAANLAMAAHTVTPSSFRAASISSSEVVLLQSVAQACGSVQTDSIKSEMDGEKVAVAAAGAKWRSDEERLLKPLLRYWLFLCVGSSVALMAPSLSAAQARPAAVPFLPAGYDFPVTCVTFAAATILLQDKFARVLERRPAPAPRLTLNPLVAWPLAVCTWLFATGCFASYLCFGVEYYFEGRWSEWAAAGVASAANLAMATRTVTRYFRCSRAFGSANDTLATLV